MGKVVARSGEALHDGPASKERDYGEMMGINVVYTEQRWKKEKS